MIGDQADVAARIKRQLPASWFGPDGTHPVLEAAVAGAAWALSYVYGFWSFARAQYRIATASGAWLDLYSNDFFDGFSRFTGETDASWSRRIRLEVFRPRNTRRAIDRAVYDLTGAHPVIFEAWRPGDCGGYGTVGLAYGSAGLYGSRAPIFEVIITCQIPQNYGIPNRGGWGSLTGGYSVGNFSFVDDSDIVGSGATLLQIVAAIERVRSAGVTYLVRFV